MADYAYTGGAVMHYPDYLDNSTGKMLIAAPGEDAVYSMTPVNPVHPVPPADGRWQETQATARLALPAPAPASAPQGGEE